MIRRRFAAGFRNFEESHKKEVHSWVKFDNLGAEPVLIAWGKRMTIPDIAEAKDEVLRASLTALRRASILARETAIRTGTRLVVVKDGKLLRISVNGLCAQPTV